MGRNKLACGEPFMVQTEHLEANGIERRSREMTTAEVSVRRLKLIQQND